MNKLKWIILIGILILCTFLGYKFEALKEEQQIDISPLIEPTVILRPIPTPTKTQRCFVYASARCCDGSLSYSANRRGTCSHHGGVCTWSPQRCN